MSRVANDLKNLGPDTSSVFSYLKKNGESIYVFVWALCITIILLNFFNVDMTDHGKKAVFKNVAVYEQFKTACENPNKNCPVGAKKKIIAEGPSPAKEDPYRYKPKGINVLAPARKSQNDIDISFKLKKLFPFLVIK